MNVWAVVLGVLMGLAVELASRAAGCTITIGGDLTACAMTASLIASLKRERESQ